MKVIDARGVTGPLSDSPGLVGTLKEAAKRDGERRVVMAGATRRRPVEELRRAVEHLGTAAELFARDLREGVNTMVAGGRPQGIASLWAEVGKVAAEARARVDRLLYGPTVRRSSLARAVRERGTVVGEMLVAHLPWRDKVAKLDVLRTGRALTVQVAELYWTVIHPITRVPARWAGFTVRPPQLQRASETAEPRPDEKVARSILQGLTVLVVDDAAEDREAMQVAFETLGARVVLAQDGQEALDKLRGGDADVILCDLRMPVMDGFEFIRRLRADRRWGELPAVAVSGFGSGSSSRQARELGFDAYLTKPVECDTLELSLRRAMEVRRQASH